MSVAQATRRSKISRLPRKGNRYAGANSRPGAAPAGFAGLVRFTGRAAWRLTLLVIATVLVAAASLGLVYGYRYLTVHPAFAIKTVEVRGAARLEQNEIMEMAGVRLGDNVVALNLAEAMHRLSGNPWIADARMRRVLPDGLVIEVNERQALFWLRVGDGLYFADAAGRAIAPLEARGFASLPLLEVESGSEDLSEGLRELVAAVQARRLPFALADIDRVRLASGGVLEVALRQPAVTVRLDAVTSAELAGGLARLRRVWADLARRGELDAATEIGAAGDKVWVRFAGVGA